MVKYGTLRKNLLLIPKASVAMGSATLENNNLTCGL
jgi:hypothetical protein